MVTKYTGTVGTSSATVVPSEYTRKVLEVHNSSSQASKILITYTLDGTTPVIGGNGTTVQPEQSSMPGGNNTGAIKLIGSNASSPYVINTDGDGRSVQVSNAVPGTTYTIAAGSVAGQRIGYKDNTLGATASPIVLSASGCTIDAASSISINLNGGYLELIWDGSSNWMVA